MKTSAVVSDATETRGFAVQHVLSPYREFTFWDKHKVFYLMKIVKLMHVALKGQFTKITHPKTHFFLRLSRLVLFAKLFMYKNFKLIIWRGG